MDDITWYKQSGFRFIHKERQVYIDPWEIPEGEPMADYLLVTHAHFDHFDKEVIARISHEHTIIIAPRDVTNELTRLDALNVSPERIIGVVPGEKRDIEGLAIETIPAYNIEKPHHPKERQWVGYVIEINGKRYYHAGDTDRIPELIDVSASIAMLPIGGTYTMDAKEAALAASDVSPALAIPMHYGYVVGKRDDAKTFKKLSDVPVEILTPKIPFSA